MKNKEQILKAIDQLPTEEREGLISEISQSVTDADNLAGCPVGYYLGTDGKCYKDPLGGGRSDA